MAMTFDRILEDDRLWAVRYGEIEKGVFDKEGLLDYLDNEQDT